MGIRNKMYLPGLFFCTIGSVCAASANGAETAPQAGTVNTGAPATQPASINELSPAQMQAAKNARAAAENQQQARIVHGQKPATKPSSASTLKMKPISTDSRPQLPQGQTVNVGSFGKINLHVKSLDLTKVLQLLSIESHKNIVASRNVTGKISADLYNVSFYNALDAILHPNGFGYRKQGNFIYVYTADELAQIKKADRKMVHAVVRLNYISAADASAFVSPLLSSSGSIAVSGKVSKGMEPSTSDDGANSFASPDTLVINDYASNVNEIKSVLKKLDVRPKQVLVEATILQANLTEANAFGVDFSIFTHLSPADLTSPLSAVNDLISGKGANGPLTQGRAIQSTVGNTSSGNSGIKVGVLGNSAAVFVRALDSVTDTTVLANPKILVLNRQKAQLLVGQKLGYLSTTQTTTAATSTVQFLNVGTQLTLRPFISSDGYVRLELKPSVSNGDTSRVVNGQVIPDSTNQELTTNVMVKSGQTVVLGGLFKQDNGVSHNQVPGLGSVPIIGAAFQGHDDSVSRSEVIFLIRPTIVHDKSMATAGREARRDIQLARLGSREELLPWSRTKLTESYMQDALQYMQKGNQKKALWNVNKALNLDPTMVDALKLKEKITGQKLYFHDRDRLQSVVDQMIRQQMKQDDHTKQHGSQSKAKNGDASAMNTLTPKQAYYRELRQASAKAVAANQVKVAEANAAKTSGNHTAAHK